MPIGIFRVTTVLSAENGTITSILITTSIETSITPPLMPNSTTFVLISDSTSPITENSIGTAGPKLPNSALSVTRPKGTEKTTPSDSFSLAVTST